MVDRESMEDEENEEEKMRIRGQTIRKGSHTKMRMKGKWNDVK